MYYLANTKASASGVQITVSASSATYLDGTVAEYSGVALAGPLDQVVAARGVGTSVNAGSTAAVPAGELVYAAVITGQPAGSYTPGSSQGISYTTRISAGSGSLDESDITSSAAGSQQGTATLSASTDWYAVAATFQPLPANSSPPTAPTGLSATSAASSRVSLQWSASTGSVQGYTVFRNGTAIGATKATTFLDQTAAPATSYTYTVDAFNAAGQQSAQSSPVQVTTPAGRVRRRRLRPAGRTTPHPTPSFRRTLNLALIPASAPPDAQTSHVLQTPGTSPRRIPERPLGAPWTQLFAAFSAGELG